MVYPVVFETEYWKVMVAEDQCYLGYMIVSANNRERPNLSALTQEEWVDFSENVVKPLEAKIKRALGAELFNWSCLMNLAYRETPPNPHVHWHVKPRYRNPVEFNGETFVDEMFGSHYQFGETRPMSEAFLQAIADKVRSA
jgi:diadenosine tetraphosphate (Ap4A) HIT family hydrolase